MAVGTEYTDDTGPAEHPERHWRRLNDELWVGRDGTRNLGTIERGRRFVWVDPDGVPHGRYAALQDAQQAAESPLAAEPLPTERDPDGLALGLMGIAIAIGVAALDWMTGMMLPV